MAQKRAHTNVSDAAWFKALGNPLRLDILEVLHRRGVASPTQLVTALGTTIKKASYHIRILEGAGFVEETHHLQRRGVNEHFFRVLLGPSLGGQQWMLLPKSLRRSALVKSVELLTRKLIAAIEFGTIEDDAAAVVQWMSTVVDSAGRDRIVGILRDAQGEIEEVHEESTGRMARTAAGANGVTPLIVALAAFRSAPLATTD